MNEIIYAENRNVYGSRRYEEKILLHRFGNPKEVADLVSFLISEKTSYINNSIIRVDGGKKC